MADKPQKSAYDLFHDEVHPQIKFTSKYMAQIRDKNNAIIAEANKLIDHDFEKLDDDDIRDKYKKAILAGIEKHTKEIPVRIGNKTIDDRIADKMRKELGYITKEEVDKIIDGSRGKYDPSQLRSEMDNILSQFSQQHYAGIVTKHSFTKEGKGHLLKYMNLEKRVMEEAITPSHLAQLLNTHVGTNGDIHSSQIPIEIRVRSKKKPAPK
jgi:hypothetical protein